MNPLLGLTKDQLSDIIEQLPDDLLADLAWRADVEMMDRAYVANEGLTSDEVPDTLRTSVLGVVG